MENEKIEKEEWRRCAVPATRYEVSNLGRMRHSRFRKILKPRVESNYYYVSIWYRGKSRNVSVHKMVALAFVEGYQDGLEVNHINGNTFDNRAINLEWVTHSYNIMHSCNVLGNKVQPIVLLDQRKMLHSFYVSFAECQRQCGGRPDIHLRVGVRFHGYEIQRISFSMYKELLRLIQVEGYTIKAAWVEVQTDLFLRKEV